MFGRYQSGFPVRPLTDDLKARGLRSTDGIEACSIGRPAARSRDTVVLRISVCVSPGHPSADSFVGIPGTATPTSAPIPGTEPGVDPQKINSVQVRLTWQISQKNKLSVYNDRILKDRGAAMTASLDPATASIVWTSPIYTTGSIKYTSTVSSKVLLEGGFSTNYERYNTVYQPGIAKDRGTPEWYSTINKQDTALGTSWNAGEAQRGMAPIGRGCRLHVACHRRNNVRSASGYWGRYARWRNANGDLRAVQQRPRLPGRSSTRPSASGQPHADAGIYGQDSWTLNRLTLNYGALEHFRVGHIGCRVEAGRFAQARAFSHRHADLEQLLAVRPRTTFSATRRPSSSVSGKHAAGRPGSQA
jgi:hypothetical protein